MSMQDDYELVQAAIRCRRRVNTGVKLALAFLLGYFIYWLWN